MLYIWNLKGQDVVDCGILERLKSLPEQEKVELLYLLDERRRLAEADPLLYFEPIPDLVEFWNEWDALIQAVFGGNRSGKTHQGAAKIVKRCLENDNQIVWAATQTMEKSRQVQQSKIYDMLQYNDLQDQHNYLNSIL